MYYIMSDTRLLQLLKKNYYEKKPGEPFIKGQAYYFTTRDGEKSIPAVCVNVLNDSGFFRISTQPLDFPLTKINNSETAWWRRGNAATSGTSARSYTRDDNWMWVTDNWEYSPKLDIKTDIKSKLNLQDDPLHNEISNEKLLELGIALQENGQDGGKKNKTRRSKTRKSKAKKSKTRKSKKRTQKRRYK